MTGRLKDLIIIRGRNYYPHDIEHAVEQAHEAFRVGHCAALGTDNGRQEQLVVVQEIEPRHRNLDADAAIQAIRRAVATHHELETHEIFLVKAGTLPKTTSGKTRRFAARDLYLNGQLKALAQWKSENEAGEPSQDASTADTSPNTIAAQQIEQWLVERVGARSGIPRDEVHLTRPFADFGLSSLDAVEISADLEKWLRCSVPPTVVYNYPTISALAEWLTNPETAFHHDAARGMSIRTVNDSAKEGPEDLEREVRDLSEAELEAYLTREMAKQEEVS
jgi:myxalamid-type polyketide synthase MxaE and MxaD